jgi:rhodanese-related sulfurtransferase
MPQQLRFRTQLCFLLIACCFSAASAFAGGAEELAEYHQNTIKDKFESVKHIDADALGQIRGDTILFDVREADEFEVSHIEGAIRVTPDISDRAFMQLYAPMIEGKAVVFYCSVGYRSSKLAESVQETLQTSGSKAIYNLEGGIFNWHNERRRLINMKGASDDIHPNDRYWGRLLERPEMIRYNAN